MSCLLYFTDKSAKSTEQPNSKHLTWLSSPFKPAVCGGGRWCQCLNVDILLNLAGNSNQMFKKKKKKEEMKQMGGKGGGGLNE